MRRSLLGSNPDVVKLRELYRKCYELQSAHSIRLGRRIDNRIHTHQYSEQTMRPIVALLEAFVVTYKDGNERANWFVPYFIFKAKVPVHGVVLVVADCEDGVVGGFAYDRKTRQVQIISYEEARNAIVENTNRRYNHALCVSHVVFRERDILEYGPRQHGDVARTRVRMDNTDELPF